MKIIHKYLFVSSTMALFAMASCTNEDVVQENKKQNEQKGVTEFAMNMDKDVMETRTKGLYTGDKIDFYWTSGDQLWVKAPDYGLQRSICSNIPANGEAPSAIFMFGSGYGNESYPVRYTGNGDNVKGDEVTIKNSQTQKEPKDGSHIGVDGDCGVDTAKKQNAGNRLYYSFTLKHKAAYITFMPFYSKTQLANTVTVTQIKLTADENIAGTYDFNDNGLAATPKENGSKSITLKLDGSFNIPKSYDYNTNAAIMVVAPGEYHNVKVEYTLYDSKTKVTGTVSSKTYPKLTFKAGENNPIKTHDLDMNLYEAKYTTWDAEKYYWNDESDVPVVNGESKKVTDPKTNYKNTTAQGASASDQVYRSCKYPNANQMAYYVWHGNPHWDETTLWVRTGHLYKGGLWLLKCANNPDFSEENYKLVDGTTADYRLNTTWTDWRNVNATWKVTLDASHKTKPSNFGDYFFLPAMGYAGYANGTLVTGEAGYYGVYWSATSYYGGGVSKAISFHFSDTEVGMSVDNRDNVYPIFKAQ